MTDFAIHTLRLRVDTNSMDGLTDVETGAMPAIWRGNDIEVQVGLFKGPAPASGTDTPIGVALLASLTLELYDVKGGTLLATKTLDSEDLDATLDAATWKDGTKQHASLQLTNTQTDIAPATGDRREVYAVLKVVTTHTPARRLTLCAGSLLIVEDGTGTVSGTPGAPPQTFRANGDDLELYNATTEKWYPLNITGALGLEQLTIGEPLDA